MPAQVRTYVSTASSTRELGPTHAPSAATAEHGTSTSPAGKPARRDIRRKILAQAEGLITGPRNTTHGDYTIEAQRIGAMWGAILKLPEPIRPEQVAACMMALKLARATTGTRNPDDWIDLIGYAALAAQLEEDLYGEP